MRLYIERRISAAIAVGITESQLNMETAAAGTCCVSNAGTGASGWFTLAGAAWPVPLCQEATNPVLPVRPGIQIRTYASQIVPFRVVGVATAIGTKYEAGITVPELGVIDLTPAAQLGVDFSPALQNPDQNANRWTPAYAVESEGFNNPVIALGDINLSGGVSSQFSRVLSSMGANGAYPYCQADTAIPSPTAPLCRVFDAGYTPNFLENGAFLSTLAGAFAGNGSPGFDEYGAFTSLIVIDVDEKFPGQDQKKETDYYLSVPGLTCKTSVTQSGDGTYPGGNPQNATGVTTFEGCLGAAQANIIPLAYFKTNPLYTGTIIDTSDVFSLNLITNLRARVAFRIEVRVSTKPQSSLFLPPRPATVPARGYNI